MIRKLFLILAVFTLTACKLNEDKKITDFNQNPEIESAIYKKHFFEKELLDAGEMEVDVVGEKTLFEGSQVPIQTEKFPEPYYVNYIFDADKDLLDLAFILNEGMVADGEELPETIFVYIEYNNEQNEIITLTQENVSGDDVGYVGLFEEEWKDLAKEYTQFVDSVN